MNAFVPALGDPGPALVSSCRPSPCAAAQGKTMFEIPVLLLGFNRPDLTFKVVTALRYVRPTRLFVAIDGPRHSRLGEDVLCAEVVRIATCVDWPCSLKSLVSASNQGCRNAVSAAITWFFNQVDEGIILEDDCLPSVDFFRFCSEMLRKHRNDQRVMAICGSNYIDKLSLPPDSYYFSYYADLWGWATWRRAWQKYNSEMTRWPAFKALGGIEALSGGRRGCEDYWHRSFDRTFHQRIDSWGYRWILTVMTEGGVACYPTRNLVSESRLAARWHAYHTGQRGPALGKSPSPADVFPNPGPAFCVPQRQNRSDN